MSLIKKFALSSVYVLTALPFILKAEIIPLETVIAVEETVTDYQMLDGQIEAVNKSTVSAQTGGVISAISYDVGDYVEKGATIAKISSQTQKSSLQEAKAAVDEARAAINRADAAVIQAEAATKEAQANYEATRAEFNRIKELFDKQIISRSQYEQSEAAMKSTQARVESAKANLSAAGAERKAASSSLSAARAGMAKAGEQLGYTDVLAPYSGIVTERHVELGEVVSAGKPIMTGISLAEMRAKADIPQRMIMDVRKYNKARIYLDNDKTGIPVDKLTIFPYADPATNAFQVRATLGSAAKGLYPGAFVKIGFEVGSEQELVIPPSAVAYRSEVTGVYVIDDKNMPSLRQVRLGGQTAEGKIRILAGLSSGEKIALDPVHAAVYLKQKHLEQQKNAKEEGKHD